MKTRIESHLVVVIAGILCMDHSTSFGQVFDSAEVLNNRAVASSPRANEEFPWLTRSSAKVFAATSTLALPAETLNRALAASPRTIEEFPELVRPAQPTRHLDSRVIATASGNRGLAASPRALEEFPELARNNATVTEKSFEIAPLK